MISSVDICNLALTKLGQDTIVALTQESETARRCNILYDRVRDQVLREHTWSFATKIEALAELANESVLGWEYLYLMPSNCLRVIKVYDEGDTDTNNYDKLLSPDTNTHVIATNLYQAYMKYIKKIEDPNLFDTLFINAFVAKLAAELSLVITGNSSLMASFIQEYNAFIAQAKAIDAQEKNIKIPKKSIYYEVR